MNGLVKLVLLILFFALISEIISKTLEFLGFSFEQYGPYLAWFYVVLIFLVILPEKKTEILSD